MVNFDEHESAVVGEAIRRGDGCCERYTAEGLNGVGVELLVRSRSVYRESVPRL